MSDGEIIFKSKQLEMPYKRIGETDGEYLIRMMEYAIILEEEVSRYQLMLLKLKTLSENLSGIIYEMSDTYDIQTE